MPLAGSWKQSGSGILVIVPQLSVADGGNHAYQTDGVHRNMSAGCDFGPLVDPDRFANKGVQLTIIDLGFGKIDLYSTHLYSGGDGTTLLGLLQDVTDQELAEVKNAQLQELATFLAQTHDPSHIGMIAGDLNIAAENQVLYTTLTSSFANLRCNDGSPTAFDDLWVDPAYGALFASSKDQVHEGRTSRDDPNDHKNVGHKDFSTICAVKAPVSQVTPTANGQDFYCDDSVPNAQNPGGDGRIDYIFVERPRSSHAFMLDVSRIRRRAFKRVQPGTVAYLSDHLGLEITLFPSPKR